MSIDTKLRQFFLAVLSTTVFCSSCYLTKGVDQWSSTKRDLERQILKNSDSYVAHYKLGIAYSTRVDNFSMPYQFSIPYHWEKKILRKAIFHLEEAIRIKPESAEAHLALGEVFGTDNISDSVSAIKHTVLAKKLSEKQKNTKGVVQAESNLRVLSKKYFSFYLLGFSEIHIPEQL